MGYGLAVRNDANFLQIDGEYRNQVLLNRITVATGTPESAGVAGAQTWNCGWYRYNARSPESLVALRCSQPTTVLRVEQVNGTTSWIIICYEGSLALEIFEFGPAPVSAESGYGLNVWDAQGRLAFSSNFSYMRAVDYLQVNYLTDKVHGQDALGASVTYAAGRKYAVCSGWGAGSSWADEFDVGLALMSFNSIDAGFRLTYPTYWSAISHGTNSTSVTDGKYILLIIDVTGL